MSNPYFVNSDDLVSGTKARASDVEANFNAVGAGFDAVYSSVQALSAAVGASVATAEADAASASTTTIGGVGPVVRVTGNTGINSFGIVYDGVKFLRFGGSLTLTHGPSLALPGGVDITTTAGDTCIAVPIGSPASGWRVEDYRRMSLPLIEDDALRLAAAAATYLSQANAAATYATITADQNSATQTISSVTGTDAITGNLIPALTSYGEGQTFRFVAAGANTGATTININGLGAKAITKAGTTALIAGDIPSGAAVTVVYDGTQFQLQNVAAPNLAGYAQLGTAQTFTATQRTNETADNDGSFDLSAALDFVCTPSGAFTLTFTNIPASPAVQKGTIILINSGGYAVAAHANTKVGTSTLTNISAAGTYELAYRTSNGVAYVTSSGALA